DMYCGQRFLRRVYAALTANPAVWANTMLIITYDEHGGFYDHVVPPIADVFEAPRLVVADPGTLGTAATDGGTTTPPPSGGGHGGLGGLHGPGGLHIPPEVLTVLVGEVLDPVPSGGTVKVPYGVRVPTLVVSPWVAAGKGPG